MNGEEIYLTLRAKFKNSPFAITVIENMKTMLGDNNKFGEKDSYISFRDAFLETVKESSLISKIVCLRDNRIYRNVLKEWNKLID